MNLNTNFVAIMWALSISMAGAIALGPTWIIAVASVAISYVVIGVILS